MTRADSYFMARAEEQIAYGVMTVPLRVIVFPGGTNLPIWAGQKQGFFERHSVAVDLTYTTSSKEQLAGLIEGRWDIGATAFDNVVAYQEGQGEAEIKREPDLFVFMGGDNGFLHLIAQADVRSFDDLKGRVLSVDALTTGFAFVLRKMIQCAGLSESDITYESVGGLRERWEAMKAGEHAGTLVLTPFELIARHVGLNVLQHASEVVPDYQGVVGTTRRLWAQQNGMALAGYVRGYLDALHWLFDPANRPAAEALLVENVPNMTPLIAAASCGVFLDPVSGFEPRARLNGAGMETVLALRSAYGVPRRSLTDPDVYVDLTWYKHAAGEDGIGTA
jgi:ABC-type nitrate/sulfonate/bicarbonate transport system substrate-binding protein